MKIFLRVVVLCLCSISNTHASEWVPYNPAGNYQNTQINTQTINTNILSNNPAYHQPTPITTYQLVPVNIYYPVIVEHTGIFCRSNRIVYVPVTQMMYQPVVVWSYTR